MRKKTYVVHSDESVFAVVQAKDKEEAFDIFAKNQIDDKIFLQDINDFSINLSFFENFYHDDQGYLMEEETGEDVTRLKNRGDRNEYIEKWVEKNIKDFWEEKPHLAEEYLREYKESLEHREFFYTPEFSEEFKIETYKLMVTKINWSGEVKIIEIDPRLEYQVIDEE